MNDELATLVGEIASGYAWKRPGEHVSLNVQNNIIVFVECIDVEGDKKFDAIVVENEMQQCELLQRISLKYEKQQLMPCYTEEALVAFETKHKVTLPTLLAFQLLRISRQLLSHAGSMDWIIDLESALVYDMPDNVTTRMRLNSTHPTTDLIIRGPGVGTLVHQGGAQEPLFIKVLQTNHTLEFIRQ